MDLNDLRAAITVISLLVFVGIVIWAYSRRNRARFEEAARLPFENDNNTGSSGGSNHE